MLQNYLQSFQSEMLFSYHYISYCLKSEEYATQDLQFLQM